MFLFLSLVSAIPSTGTVIGGRLNVRSRPDVSSPRLGQLPNGSTVTITGESGDFWQIDYNGQVGYVLKEFVDTGSGPDPQPTPDIPVVHTKIRDALLESEWKSKAYSLTIAYDVAIANGYSINAAVGLMANLVHEGNYGVVEYAFSKYHNFGFYLPSGSTNGKAKTIKDIEYVRDWTTSNVLGFTLDGPLMLKKGSCGFGSIQWSFGRRVNFAKVCLDIMKSDEDVTDTNWAIAEAQYISQELQNTYYTKIQSAAVKYGDTV